MYSLLTGAVHPFRSTTLKKAIDATITSKGQITIPVEIRKHLGLKVHDRITFIIDSTDGSVRVQPARFPNVASLAGFAGSLQAPLSLNEMRDIAREEALVERYSKKNQ